MKITFVISLFLLANINAEENRFFKDYCVSCHNNEKHKGGINFEDDISQGELIDSMDQVLTGDMPPKKAKKHPSKLESQAFINSIKKTLKQKTNTISYRWMLKKEYEHTIKNFFELQINTQLSRRMKNEFLMPDSQMDKNLVSAQHLDNILSSNKSILDLFYPEEEQLNKIWNLYSSDYISPYPKSPNEIYKDGSSLLKTSAIFTKWRAPLSGEYEITFYAKALEGTHKLTLRSSNYRVRSVNSKPKISSHDKGTTFTMSEKNQIYKAKISLKKDQPI